MTDPARAFLNHGNVDRRSWAHEPLGPNIPHMASWTSDDVPSSGNGAGTGDHRDLTHRNDANQHTGDAVKVTTTWPGDKKLFQPLCDHPFATDEGYQLRVITAGSHNLFTIQPVGSSTN